MKFPKEINKNLALFEVVDSNQSPVPIGGVVEFYDYYECGWSDLHGGDDENALDCAQTEILPARQHGAVFGLDCTWIFGPNHLRPLTKLAEEILQNLQTRP